MANDDNNHGQNGLNQHEVVVVMVPFPAQGHLNQLLHLSRLISAYDIPIHFVGTTTHTRQAKLRVHGWDPTTVPSIQFHEFPTPSFPSPPPNPNSTIKFPAHLQPSFEISTLYLREPIAKLISSLSLTAKRIVIIYDSMMSSVIQDFVSHRNAEAYTFHSISAFSVFYFFWEIAGRPFAVEDNFLEELPSFNDCFSPEFLAFVNAQVECHGQKFNSGNLVDTCKVVEDKYLDLLARQEISGGVKQWAIGPFNPVEISDNKHPDQRHKCLKWLDNQENNSVIYVSFGTTTSFTDEQFQEIAIGLGKSEQKFIWVVRDADKGDVFNGDVRRVELPKGFEARVEGRGLVVRDWAPQLEILGHPSTGGFISHCGWNSIMESITMGVPIATWPMHSDQPWNAIIVAKIMKIGIIARDWARRDELVTSLTVEKVVRRLMASKEGEEIRKRTADLGSSVRRSVAKGGVTRMEMDSFIEHISR